MSDEWSIALLILLLHQRNQWVCGLDDFFLFFSIWRPWVITVWKTWSCSRISFCEWEIAGLFKSYSAIIHYSLYTHVPSLRISGISVFDCFRNIAKSSRETHLYITDIQYMPYKVTPTCLLLAHPYTLKYDKNMTVDKLYLWNNVIVYGGTIWWICNKSLWYNNYHDHWFKVSNLSSCRLGCCHAIQECRKEVPLMRKCSENILIK